MSGYHGTQEGAGEVTGIELIFHVGRPKTATTFLQKYASCMPNTLFIGKDIVRFGCGFRSDALKAAHYDLFPTYRIENANHQNPTRNSYFSIVRYADLIADEWRRDAIATGRPVTNIIISDECISDYANYLGEFNVSLVKVLSEELKVRIEKISIELLGGQGVSVTRIFAMSIREQADVLQSFYGYSYPSLSQRFTNFGQFCDWVLSNPEASVQGGCYYFECVQFYKFLLGDDFQMVVAPYEYLLEDQRNSSNTFFQTIFSHTTPVPEDFFVHVETSERVNANSGESGHQLRMSSRATRLIAQLGLHGPMARLVKRSPFMTQLARKVLSKDRGPSRSGDKPDTIEFSASEREIAAIRELYRESNGRLADYASLDLKRLGYAC